MFVELVSVTKIYNGGQPNEVVAVKDATLEVDRGEMICLQGPSGSGKSTLLSIIGCVVSPTSGLATIGGKKISRLPDHFLTVYRRELIGFVFQDYNLLPHLSVVENVALPLYPLGISPARRTMLADKLLERFGLMHRRKFPVTQLSGGEVQRTAIARALINNPSIIIADEPTAHLDRKLAQDVLEVLVELKNEGRTVILSSHDPAVASFSGMDRVMTVESGVLSHSR